VAVLPHADSLRGAAARRIVEAADEHRIGVLAWTVDAPEEMRRLAESGVAGIITNVPDVACSVLEG
jgi:glycerophosphoryl diester phosphodiesterase